MGVTLQNVIVTENVITFDAKCNSKAKCNNLAQNVIKSRLETFTLAILVDASIIF